MVSVVGAWSVIKEVLDRDSNPKKERGERDEKELEQRPLTCGLACSGNGARCRDMEKRRLQGGGHGSEGGVQLKKH